MKIGSAYEFFSRPEWPALQSAYGLRFSDRVNYNSTFMYDALENGDVDVIAAFSSDGRIESLDLVLLDDPQNAIPPYDAVILLSPRASKRPRVAEVLQLLIGRIDVELMRQANYLVDRDMDKKTVHQAAGYLQQEVRGKDGSKKGAAEK
jgi:osmoprotectant transport system permease protein